MKDARTDVGWLQLVRVDSERPGRMGRPHVSPYALILLLLLWVAGAGGWLGFVGVVENGGRAAAWFAFTVGVVTAVTCLSDELPGGGRTSAGVEVVGLDSPLAAAPSMDRAGRAR